MLTGTFKSHDGKELALYTWDEVQNPKAVVKIAHGMAEHSARYDDFAQYLNKQGYVVVMNDHRGHGFTADEDSLGYDEGDIFFNNVLDQVALIDYCKQKYNLPVVMMGHSSGSFVTQAVMEKNPAATGYVLSGSDYMKGLAYTAAGVIANNMCKRKGGRYPAEMLAKLSFGGYEKKIPGKNNWLSRDEEQVKKYNEDPMCGFVCSANFYRTFMAGAKTLYKKENYSGIDVEKPILIVSGANDPVGEYSKGVKKLDAFYKKIGVKDVTTILYPEARHEILNETNKDEVYQDIADWIQRVIEK